jgi:phosphoadenosine phosphosulfate reductase
MSNVLEYVNVDYDTGAGQTPADYPTLAAKFEQAVDVTRRALAEYRRPAVLWTGGKDSTLVLYVLAEVAREQERAVPPAVFIDHFQHFPETVSFVETWADRCGLDLQIARNEDFVDLGVEPGQEVAVRDLDETNQRELARLGYDRKTLVLDADTFEGNHLLKTVVLNRVLTERGFDAVFSGVRWDEQAARADETFFSPRHDAEKYPPHDRVHPILQFEEADVWAAFWEYLVPDVVEGYPAGYVPAGRDDLPDGIEASDLPVSPKYFEGYRSLGTESGSGQSNADPAWLQNLAASAERAGRAQDKENLMERLRDLGYM